MTAYHIAMINEDIGKPAYDSMQHRTKKQKSSKGNHHARTFKVKYLRRLPYSFKLRAVNTTLRSINISLSLNVCQRKLATNVWSILEYEELLIL